MSGLLLDTHVMLAVVDPEGFAVPRTLSAAIEAGDEPVFVSAVSLWEVAIKHRLGKLPLTIELGEWPSALSQFEIGVLDITSAHVLAECRPVARTKDPFDRLLLAVAQVEGLNFVTVDKAIYDHPLAWRP